MSTSWYFLVFFYCHIFNCLFIFRVLYKTFSVLLIVSQTLVIWPFRVNSLWNYHTLMQNLFLLEPKKKNDRGLWEYISSSLNQAKIRATMIFFPILLAFLFFISFFLSLFILNSILSSSFHFSLYYQLSFLFLFIA